MNTNDRIDVLLDESQDLEFKLDVQGASTKNIKTRMIIETGDGFDITIDGLFSVVDSVTTFHIPILSQSLVPKQYNCIVEAVIEARHYVKMGEYTIEAQLPPIGARASMVGTTQTTPVPVVTPSVTPTPSAIPKVLQNLSSTKEGLSDEEKHKAVVADAIRSNKEMAEEAKKQAAVDAAMAVVDDKEKAKVLANEEVQKTVAVSRLNKSINIFKRTQELNKPKLQNNSKTEDTSTQAVAPIDTVPEADPVDDKAQAVESILSDMGIPVTKHRKKRKHRLFSAKD